MSPQIAAVETFVVRYPVTGQFKFFRAPSGEAPTRQTVLVRIIDDLGRAGWGQSVPSPTWSYETIETVRTTIDRYLGPALLGLHVEDEAAIRRTLDREIAPSFSTGQPICKAGLDLALFDLNGKIRNASASERWNRKGREKITLSWTIDVRELDELEKSVAEAHARGFANFNLKVGTDWKLDVAVCKELRALAPGAFVWADANGGYDLETALATAPRFADLGIAALEQPLPGNRLSGYRELRRQRALPILMDEPIVSLDDLRAFHELGLLDGVAMKVSRCGGLTEAHRILDYMHQNGLQFFASGLTDPDLSLAASLLLYGAFDLQHPAALNAPQFLTGSFLQTPIRVDGDQAHLPTGPGLGVTVDEAAVLAQQ